MNSWAESSGRPATKAEPNLRGRSQAVMDAVAAADATMENASTRMQSSPGKAKVAVQVPICTPTRSKHLTI